MAPVKLDGEDGAWSGSNPNPNPDPDPDPDPSPSPNPNCCRAPNLLVRSNGAGGFEAATELPGQVRSK